MKKLQKLFSAIVLIFIVVFSLPLTVSANSPPPADHLTVVLSNLPEDAVYADLLVKISRDDPNFVDFQSNDYAGSISKSNEIVNYSDDGFYSFTFHYKNSKSNIKIEHYYEDLFRVDFCNGLEYQDYLTQYENLLNHYRDIKVALLDKDFNIIIVSDETQLPKKNDAFVFDGDIYYDFDVNSLEFDTQINAYYIVLVGFLSVLMIFLSIGAEIIVSLFFGFKVKQLKIVFIINACSQVIMRLLYLALPFTYLIETIILEIIVYTVEFLIYKKCFKEVSSIKLIAYTITANTLSLLLGIFLDWYFPI